MDQRQLFTQLVTYGLENRKKKNEIMVAALKTGQFDPMTIASNLKALEDAGVFSYEQEGLAQPEYNKLSPAQQTSVSDFNATIQSALEARDLASQVATGPIEGRIGKFKQSMTGNADPQFVKLNAQISQIKSNFMKALAGANVTESEQKRLMQFLPDVTDPEETIKIKLDNFVAELSRQRSSVFDVAGASEGSLQQPIAQPTGVMGQTTQGQTGPISEDLQIFNATLQHAQANPNDPQAQQFLKMVESGQIDWKTGKLVSNQPTKLGKPTEQSTEVTEEEKGLLTKIGEKAAQFFGGEQWGKFIGEHIGINRAKKGYAGEQFKRDIEKVMQWHKEGKIDDKMRDELLAVQEKNAKEAFGYKGPSFKQLAADTALMATSVLGGAELRGATLAATAGKTALWGASQGALSAQAESKDLNLKNTVIDAALGGALGAATPVVGKALGSAAKGSWRAMVGKNTPEEALGEILQGKTKDLKPGQRALAILDVAGNKKKADAVRKLIDSGDLDERAVQRFEELEKVYRNGVKTYADVKVLLDDSIYTLSSKVDEALGKDKTLYKLDDLAVTGKTKGGKEVKTNYVEKALTHLEELYKKIGDEVEAGNVAELLQKAKTEGLTKVEVNQIARTYGIEFGDKAFNKVGDALTSVNAQMYENVREGVKEVVRQGLDSDAAKQLDALISDSIKTRELIKKNIEAVNRLEQKAEKMGIGRALVRKAFQVADMASFGLTRGIRESLIQSNVGKKTMNYLDIEEKLTANLRILQKAQKMNNPGKLEAALKKFNRIMLEKTKNAAKGGKISAGMSIKDVSNGKKFGSIKEDITSNDKMIKVVKDLGFRKDFQDFMAGIKGRYPELEQEVGVKNLKRLYDLTPQIMGKEMRQPLYKGDKLQFRKAKS